MAAGVLRREGTLHILLLAEGKEGWELRTGYGDLAFQGASNHYIISLMATVGGTRAGRPGARIWGLGDAESRGGHQ